jgi:dihydroorotate dehydrogenase
MYSLVRPLLFTLPPETAHGFTLQTLSAVANILPKPKHDPKTACTVMGIHFPNRIGLAAGLDKNGEHVTALSRLGFGFLELGTVTPKPQVGNPKPRLFRLPKEKALINRLGFNNKGVDHLVEAVSALKERPILGINIGKGFQTPIPAAVEDYLQGLVRVYPIADYVTINISSPNTPDLRQMQTPDLLIALLSQLKDKQAELAKVYQRYVPIAVKIAPDLTIPDLEEMANIFLSTKVDAVIATNTTTQRYGVNHHPLSEQLGGLSGAPLFLSSLDIVRFLYRHLGKVIPVIAAGGIMSRADGEAKLAAGAQLLQVYTGLIYQGPNLIRQLATL